MSGAGAEAYRRKHRWRRVAVVAALLIGLAVYFGYVHDESYVWLRMRLARYDASSGREDQALALYDKVIARSPSGPDAYLEKADTLDRIGGAQREALDCLIDGWEATGWDMRILEAAADRYLEMAGAYVRNGRSRDALGVLDEASAVLLDGDGDIDPDILDTLTGQLQESYLEAYDALAREMVEAGDAAAAREMIEGLPEIYSTSAQLRARLLEAYLAQARQQMTDGYYSLAARFLLAAPEDIRESDGAREILLASYLAQGERYLGRGDVLEAREVYEAALAIDAWNADAIAGLATVEALEAARSEDEAAPDVTVDGFRLQGALECELSARAFTMSLPVTGSASLRVALQGLSDAQPRLSYEVPLVFTAAGVEERRTLADEAAHETDAAARDALYDAYHALVHAAQPTGNVVALNRASQQATGDAAPGHDIACAVYRYHIPVGGLTPLAEAFAAVMGMEADAQGELLNALPLVTADVTRYVSVESGELVRIEADLSGTDIAAILQPYVDGELPLGAQLQNGTATFTADVERLTR